MKYIYSMSPLCSLTPAQFIETVGYCADSKDRLKLFRWEHSCASKGKWQIPSLQLISRSQCFISVMTRIFSFSLHHWKYLKFHLMRLYSTWAHCCSLYMSTWSFHCSSASRFMIFFVLLQQPLNLFLEIIHVSPSPKFRRQPVGSTLLY